jgi:hypothetical protein
VEISFWTVAMPIGLTLLTLLLSGPGMWSDSWGWGWLERRKRRDAAACPPPADDEA